MHGIAVASCLEVVQPKSRVSTPWKGLRHAPPKKLFNARRLFLKPFLGQKCCIFSNSWQTGFWELLHVRTEVASDCRLRITSCMLQPLSTVMKNETTKATAAAVCATALPMGNFHRYIWLSVLVCHYKCQCVSDRER